MKVPDLLKSLMEDRRILLFLLVVFVGFLSWFLIVPKVNQILEARRVLSVEKVRLEKLQTKMADLEGLNEFELTDRFNLFLRAVPENKDVISVMANLRNQAQEKDLLVENLQVSPGEISATASAIAKIGKLSFKFDLSGKLSDILGFFSKLRDSLPLVSLNKVRISFSKEGASAEAEIVLESYFLSLPQTLGAIDRPVSKLTTDEAKILDQISQYTFIPPAQYSPGAGRQNPFSL